MKKLFYLFAIIFSLSVAAQKDSILDKKLPKSVVTADKVNIVYRGILNPISIAVNDAKSFSATAQGLKLREGKYYLTPGSGKEVIVTVNIILNDNSEIIEKHKFRIESIPSINTFLNGSNCYNCMIEMTKEDFTSAEISLGPPNFLFDFNLKVKSFKVKFFKEDPIEVEGNKFNNEVLKKINRLKKGTIFYIVNIKYSLPESICFGNLPPIKVIIFERKIPQNFYETKAFIKDSLRKLKIERKLMRKNSKKPQL